MSAILQIPILLYATEYHTSSLGLCKLWSTSNDLEIPEHLLCSIKKKKNPVLKQHSDPVQCPSCLYTGPSDIIGSVLSGSIHL